MLAPLLLATVIAADPLPIRAPVPPPCSGLVFDGITILGPSRDEADVPLNTSIWIHADDAALDASFVLTVRDAVTDAAIPFVLSPVFDATMQSEMGPLPRSGARAVLDRELEPERTYRIEWTWNGTTGGHAFTTGRTRDDEAPAPPRTIAAQPFADGPNCIATFGLSIAHDGDPSLLYVPISQGLALGLHRGSPVEARIGIAGAPVVGELVAFDLAGNRSASGAAFSGTTPPPVDLCSVRFCGPPEGTSSSGVFSCASTRPADGAWVLVALAGLAAARRRRRLS